MGDKRDKPEPQHGVYVNIRFAIPIERHLMCSACNEEMEKIGERAGALIQLANQQEQQRPPTNIYRCKKCGGQHDAPIMFPHMAIQEMFHPEIEAAVLDHFEEIDKRRAARLAKRGGGNGLQ